MHDYIHVCVFLFSKNCFKSFLDTWLAFSYRKLDTSSTPGGSIEPYLLCLMFLYLDTCSTPVSVDGQILDTWLGTSWHLLLSSFTEVLFILPCVIQTLFLSISLDYSVSSPPKPLPLTPNLYPVILQAFSSFHSLGKLLISFIYMHFMFWNLGCGVFENFWGFSKLMS